MADNVHSVVRHRVKQELRTMDWEEPDELTLLDVEADCKEMGLQDWGTKIGMEFDSCDESGGHFGMTREELMKCKKEGRRK